MHHLLGYVYNQWAILKTSFKTLSIYEIRQVNPRIWQHLGRARITNQTPSSLQLGTQTDPITPEHADARAKQKATACGVKETHTHTCTRYHHDFASLIKQKRFIHDFAVFIIKLS